MYSYREACKHARTPIVISACVRTGSGRAPSAARPALGQASGKSAGCRSATAWRPASFLWKYTTPKFQPVTGRRVRWPGGHLPMFGRFLSDASQMPDVGKNFKWELKSIRRLPGVFPMTKNNPAVGRRPAGLRPKVRITTPGSSRQLIGSDLWLRPKRVTLA